MRIQFLIALMISLLIAGVYWYQATETICPAPLAYRIGNIDSSFNLGLEEAKKHVEEAESVWENGAERELFVYDDTAEFVVEFVFDERQETANNEIALSQTLDEQRQESEKVQNSVESLQLEYNKLAAAYEAREVAYETRLTKYNTEVNRYNDRGGAPPDIYEELEDERVVLNKEAEELSNLADELNKLAGEINRLSEKGNRLVESYNREVAQYNSEFGFSREFTQGDYQNERIHIYKFSSDAELITVLAHEFGHALGVDHVEGTSSLMYYLLEDTNNLPTLSEEDLFAYYAVCGTEETFSQKTRRAIREFLEKIK